MRRRHLGADARLALGTTGKEKPIDIDALLQHPRRHLLRQRRVAEHHRDDRMAVAGKREAELDHFGAERCALAPAVPQGIAIVDQVEDFERGAGDDRRQRVGEQIGPRALAQPVDDLGLADV